LILIIFYVKNLVQLF